MVFLSNLHDETLMKVNKVRISVLTYPTDKKELERHADARGIPTAQLIRKILHEWVVDNARN